VGLSIGTEIGDHLERRNILVYFATKCRQMTKYHMLKDTAVIAQNTTKH